jgi:hypothetical protein
MVNNKMSIDQILEQTLTTDRNLQQVTQSEVKQEPIKPDSLNFSDLALSLTPLSFVFIWAIFLLILRNIRTNLDNKMVFKINSLQKVPCKNCRFFANNHYLKCAVQPDIVLTEEAINCCEYSPKKGNFSPKNLFR